ncbi:type VI secretion system tip protein TssI/VgrG [Achromobacter denitrificans]|uniref:type VI secretion system tip protein TssI/VgrG n=2 Tax=Achromobacter denitrificans TaxID=32002 RepID=UPI0023E8BE06|nr:type VI secretion system tip protein TssI/VgrG [Achromobacter denitrificans]MDF3852369.1 type VI secretion system tip protein TssI/VgrG [Achromobacter denitrificans]
MNALPSNAPAYSTLNIATLSQQARLLRLTTALDAELVVEHMSLREGVSRLFSLTLDCLAASAELDVAALLGKEISVSLLQADGSMRRWHAVVEGVDALGADGGLARYRLHAAPWMAALALRRDSFVYQDLSVQDIVSEVFADYPQAAFAFELTHAPKPRPVCTQYRESDLAFVQRILAEAGLCYRFEHQQDEAQGAGGGARHRVVIFDADAARPEDPSSPLRFHRSDATETRDSITRFAAAQSVRPNSVARAAWNERSLTAHAAQSQSQVRVEALPVLEDYDYAGHGRYADDDAAEQSAARSLRAHESRLVRFEGAGTARSLAPGRIFALSQHDRYAQGGGGQAIDELAGNRYVLVDVTHEATNNLGGQAAQVLNTPDMERGTYRNRFSAQPEAAALMPAWRARPTAPEGLAAVVVSASEAPITSDRDLRVKVQFPWQRGEKPLTGGLSHRTHGDASGNAPGDDRSGTWLRVASAQAGPNWGAHHLPRGGTEVIVEFIDGDIDQPVVAGQLYNDADLPPWSAGENGDANHAGVLSGWHSQGLDGAGRNQWVFDDTKGKLRTRLASSTAATQLGLGHLVEQDLDDPSRGQWRGTGFELRSDAWAVVRSGQGMLISATAREQAKSTQADAQEALLLLRGAQDASRRLNDSASQHQARPLAAAEGYDELLKALDPEQDGRYTRQVNGQNAGKAVNGQRAADANIERIDGPHLLVDAPNSLNLATPASAVLHAGEHLHATAQSDAHVAATQTYAAVSARSASVFAQQGPIRAISAQAPVSLHAHTDILEALAGQDITVTSSAEGIEILGNQRVTLQAAGGSVTLDGADIVFKGPGLFSVKGATHNFVGPGSDAASLPALPSTTVDDPLIVSAELVHKDGAFATAAKKAGTSLMAGFGGATGAAGAAGKLSELAGQANTLASMAKNPMSALSAAPGLLGGASPAVGGLLNTAKNAMGLVSQAQAMVANPMSALPAAKGLLGAVAPGAGGLLDGAASAAGAVSKAAEFVKNPMSALPAATDMLASVAPEGASQMIGSAAGLAGMGAGAAGVDADVPTAAAGASVAAGGADATGAIAPASPATPPEAAGPASAAPAAHAAGIGTDGAQGNATAAHGSQSAASSPAATNMNTTADAAAMPASTSTSTSALGTAAPTANATPATGISASATPAPSATAMPAQAATMSAAGPASGAAAGDAFGTAATPADASALSSEGATASIAANTAGAGTAAGLAAGTDGVSLSAGALGAGTAAGLPSGTMGATASAGLASGAAGASTAAGLPPGAMAATAGAGLADGAAGASAVAGISAGTTGTSAAAVLAAEAAGANAAAGLPPGAMAATAGAGFAGAETGVSTITSTSAGTTDMSAGASLAADAAGASAAAGLPPGAMSATADANLLAAKAGLNAEAGVLAGATDATGTSQDSNLAAMATGASSATGLAADAADANAGAGIAAGMAGASIAATGASAQGGAGATPPGSPLNAARASDTLSASSADMNRPAAPEVLASRIQTSPSLASRLAEASPLDAGRIGTSGAIPGMLATVAVTMAAARSTQAHAEGGSHRADEQGSAASGTAAPSTSPASGGTREHAHATPVAHHPRSGSTDAAQTALGSFAAGRAAHSTAASSPSSGNRVFDGAARPALPPHDSQAGNTQNESSSDDATARPSAPPNAALVASLAAGAGSLLGATASAASDAGQLASLASTANGSLPTAAALPSIASQAGAAAPGVAAGSAMGGDFSISSAASTQVEAAAAVSASGALTQSAPSLPASNALASGASSTLGTSGAMPAASSAPGTDAVLNTTPFLADASAQTPGFVPGSAPAGLPQGAGVAGMQSGAGVGLAGAGSGVAIGAATPGSGAAAATEPAMASGASAVAAPGADASIVSGQGASSSGTTGLSANPGSSAATSRDSGARASAPFGTAADAGAPAGAGERAGAGANANASARAASAPAGASSAGAPSVTPGTSAPVSVAAATAPPTTVSPAASPDAVLGSTTARAAGMSDSVPARSATDLSAAGGAGAAAGANAGAAGASATAGGASAAGGAAIASGSGASGIAAVAAGGGLATFAQQAGAASTAMTGASTLLSGGVSASVGAAIVPVMTQALNATGDRAAALGSAVDTLFTLPDVKQANIPAVAGAILSMPGLSSSAVPGVIGAILQSPTLATETLPKVAEVLMKIPGVAESPLPQIARDVLDTIGLGPVARTQGTNLPGDTPTTGDSGRVVPGTSTYRGRQDGARLQYVNLERVDERWNDGNALTTTERQTNRPRIHVEFNRPGSHRFTITVKADPGNIAYSSRERGRRPSYQEPHANPRSYVTNADGTRIVDDIALPAAGRNVYLFEVRDERGQLIKTERVETARRLYIQEVICMSARPAGHLADVTPVAAEFALHGIDMIQLPRLTFRGRSAVDAADNVDAQQAIMDAVRRVYASSPGKQREPYTLVVCHVDRLAAPGTSGDMRLPVPAGPGGRVMTVPIVNDDRTLASLWYEFDDSDDWLVHARYIHTDASGAERSIPIPRHLMTPVRESSGAVFSVTVDLTRISPTPLRGVLNIQFNTVAASYAGLAITGTNLLFVSTLDPYEPNSQAYLTETLAHEMGHLLGMVPSGPDWPGLRNEDPSADDSKLDPPQHFYYNMGGHCYFGLPNQNGQYTDEIGQCVMYGITCANIHFCPSCSKAVRKVDCSEGWPAF